MSSAAWPEAIDEAIEALSAARVVERIWRRDHTVWQEDPTEITEPSRLGWLDVIETMADQVETLKDFAAQARVDGLTKAVLMGMGGSSLAPELFARFFGYEDAGLELEVLDTTDPATIAALTSRLEPAQTLFIVSSKSGTTQETLSHFEHFWRLVPDGSHFVAITDEGTPLAKRGAQLGFRRVFINPGDIGGRYSALSYFGLVSAALLGVDLDVLLRAALAMKDACLPEAPREENPGARLGAFLGKAAISGRDKLTLLIPEEQAALGDWIEQLLAESTGKHGTGIIPVLESPGPEGGAGEDRAFVVIGPMPASLDPANQPVFNLPVPEALDIGAEFFRWEFATAIASYFLGINPFDQPDVQAAKDATGRFLGDAARQRTVETPPAASVLGTVQAGDYIGILAYLTRSPEIDAAVQGLRSALGKRYSVPATSGFGPRYLHSSGQLHKGGPPSGVFLVLTDNASADVEIPGQAYTFGELRRAQALGDIESLMARQRRVSWINLGTEPVSGIMELRKALGLG